jgi:HlyD family secretion protein
MRKGTRAAIVAVVIVAAAGAGAYAFRDRIFPGSAGAASAKDPALAITKVTRGQLSMTVSASGKLEPENYATIRPDPNMPTRKLTRILAREGSTVGPGQALAQIDSSGLDLDLQSARANYQAQTVKLVNLKSQPTAEELAQSRASLEQARQELEKAQENLATTRSLADKNLASQNQLADAERQVTLAGVRLDAAQKAHETVAAGPTEDLLQAQESAVAQAKSALEKAQLILEAAVIRSPMAGVVTNIVVKVGDLVGPSSEILSVASMQRMILLAQVNENDVGQVRVGQPALVVPAAYPDEQLRGTVTQLDLTAQVQGNVSVFNASIEVPNRDRQLFWGMSADADIRVLNLNDVLTLPNSAVRTSGGASTVTILDQGQPVSWDVQIGATDGVRTQILAGLDEGQEVVIPGSRGQAAAVRSQTTRNGPGGDPGMMFRALR